MDVPVRYPAMIIASLCVVVWLSAAHPVVAQTPGQTVPTLTPGPPATLTPPQSQTPAPSPVPLIGNGGAAVSVGIGLLFDLRC